MVARDYEKFWARVEKDLINFNVNNLYEGLPGFNMDSNVLRLIKILVEYDVVPILWSDRAFNEWKVVLRILKKYKCSSYSRSYYYVAQ